MMPLSLALLLLAQDPAAQAYKAGQKKFKAGDTDGAIADFTESIKADPSNSKAFSARALASIYKGQQAAALEDLTQAIRLTPKEHHNYTTRGWLRGSMQDHPGAIADFTKAIELNPEEGSSYFFRGRSHYDAGHWKEASQDYARASRFKTGTYDDSIRLHHWLADARQGLRDTTGKPLRDHFGSRLPAGPKDHEARVAAFLLGDLKAEDLLRAAEELKDVNAHHTRCQARFFLGTKALLDGDLRAAQDHFEKAVETKATEWRDWGSASSEAKRLASP